MKLMLRIHVLTVIAASSYVTLGLANADAARSLWWAYGGVSFVLALINLIMERHPPTMPTPSRHRKFDRADKALAFISWLLAGIAVALMVLGLWSVHLTQQQNQALDDIQQSRVDNTFKMCRDQNMRHDATVIQLDSQLLLALHQQPALTLKPLEAQIDKVRHHATGRHLQLVQTHDFTVLLIEALAPHQDCEQQLVTRFGAHHRTPSRT